MLKKGKPEPNLLPGADAEADCQTSAEPNAIAVNAGQTKEGAEPQGHDHEHDVSWRDVGTQDPRANDQLKSWLLPRARWSILLERVALAAERPANRMIGSAQLNPFYHTGAIATLLLVIVALSGFYLFLFFQYGFDASYEAVSARIEAPFIARTIRAIHRYASGALLVTTLLHAFRTLFMERFRGPRWLAWVTGLIMTALLWFAGVTGYWLIWDQRAQLINDAFVDFLEAATPFAAPYMVAIVQAVAMGVSWPLFLGILAVHVLLFLIVTGFYWLHIKRLSRPKWLPPAFWVVGIGIVVLFVSALFPAGMLPQADPTRLPGRITFDPFFLFYLPARENVALNWLVWAGLILITIVLALLPWSGRRRKAATGDQVAALPRPAVNIIRDRCSGCTVCALDCPYGAIKMVERTDCKRHKYIASADPSLCVSCGICVGSCDGVAVTLGQSSPSIMWDTVANQLALVKLRGFLEDVQVVFTCERHAVQGGRHFVSKNVNKLENLEVITLPCVGSAPPDLLTRTLEEGVGHVHIIGCPADDCANREGNLWLERRITRERVPRLRRPYANGPITASWLPPDDFQRGIQAIPKFAGGTSGEPAEVDFTALRQLLKPVTWRSYVVAFFLLALVMVGQVLLTDLPFLPYAGQEAAAQIVIPDVAAPIGRNSYIGSTLGPQLDLRLEVDGEPVVVDQLQTAEIWASETSPYYRRLEMTSGKHHIRLYLSDPATATLFVLADFLADVNERDLLTIPSPLPNAQDGD